MSTEVEKREVWQRGPVEGVPALLQPVAHALLQAVEEVDRYTKELSEEQLWERPAGVASVGFHLMHIAGVVDRLFTYAKGEPLTVDQLKDLAAESSVHAVSVTGLVQRVRVRMVEAVEQLRGTSESTLTERRLLGRKQIPTTVIGLLFHAAEHTQRHVGQVLVTTRVLKAYLRSPSHDTTQ